MAWNLSFFSQCAFQFLFVPPWQSNIPQHRSLFRTPSEVLRQDKDLDILLGLLCRRHLLLARKRQRFRRIQVPLETCTQMRYRKTEAQKVIARIHIAENNLESGCIATAGLRQGRVQPVKIGGMAISVIFVSEISLWLRYCKRDEVYFTTLLW